MGSYHPSFAFRATIAIRLQAHLDIRKTQIGGNMVRSSSSTRPNK